MAVLHLMCCLCLMPETHDESYLADEVLDNTF